MFHFRICTKCIYINWKGVANTQKAKMFSSILKAILRFPYQNAQGCIFFFVHWSVFSQRIKMHKVIWHNAAPHSPHVLVSAQGSANLTLMFGCDWVINLHPGPGWSTQWGKAAPVNGVEQEVATVRVWEPPLKLLNFILKFIFIFTWSEIAHFISDAKLTL